MDVSLGAGVGVGWWGGAVSGCCGGRGSVVLNKQQREMRAYFKAIAVVEHHVLSDSVLSVYDICDRLGQVWPEIQKEAHASAFTLDADCILALNTRIARSLDAEPGTFRNKGDWLSLVENCGDIDDDPSHVYSWIFSSLYWTHLSCFKLATAWVYVNALRIQHGYPEYRLATEKLGPFMESLCGAGPPLFDGQTFYPECFSE